MWVGKKNHKFQKAKPYQVGTLIIVAMQKRESSPAKKMFKSSTAQKNVFHLANYKNGRVVIVEKCKY